MNIEHHDLAHEFPEHREKIHSLKMGSTHFSKLFEVYHTATKEVKHLEGEGMSVTAQKKTRALLKDQLCAIIIA
ncbi:MAG: GTP-binding protein [Methylotenera sp.]|nr:GTP-binding protein [Methylotenera sp.]MSP99477.1 GTP-binding protein [Methylotenera sp.]